MDLTRAVDDIVTRVESVEVAQVAAEAIALAMRRSAEHYLGADLRMSGLRAGPVAIDVEPAPSRAAVVMSGATWALADQGRRRRVPARAARRSALVTPWGPRANVAGSTWAGFGITDRHGDEALRAGTEAAIGAIGESGR